VRCASDRSLAADRERCDARDRTRERALFVKRLPRIDVAADPGDNYLLAMAAAGDAEYLVTGDKSDLLALGQHRGTRLATVQAMVSKLKLR
jgi:predicted nucleic acid-binding protein